MSVYKCDICGAETTNDQSFKVDTGKIFEIHRCDNCDNRIHREIMWETDNEHTA